MQVIIMDKTLLRKKMKILRENIPQNLRLDKSRILLSKSIESIAYKECKKILCFVNMGSEPNTIELLKTALSDGKIVACPYALPNSRIMHFIQIDSLDGMVKSPFGAYEPIFDERKTITPDNSTLIIVPALAFDKEGYRIGYGGGYYDTYFENNPHGYKIGIAFDEMILNHVPRETHDKPIDMLITDKEALIWKLYK